MSEQELIQISKIQGKIELLQYLVGVAHVGIETKTPSSELWRALLAEQLSSCERDLGELK